MRRLSIIVAFSLFAGAYGCSGSNQTERSQPDSASADIQDTAEPDNDTSPDDTSLLDTDKEQTDVETDLKEKADTTNEETTEEVDSETSTGRLSGVWALKTVLGAKSQVPVVGEINSQTIAISRFEMSQNGETIQISDDPCDLSLENETGLVETIIPEAFVESIPVEQKTASIGDGQNFVQEKTYQVYGAELEDKINDPLPEEPDDPAVVDQDGDGKPGMTIRVSGAANGEIYIVQRGWQSLDGEIINSDRIEGLVDWGQQQKVLDATSSTLENRPDSRKHPDEQKSFFKLIRIDSSMSCSDILQERESIFGGN